MRYQFDFRPYQRQFKQPLQTNHGTWDVRFGLILRLIHETQASWGEIAPLSWFGSETWEQALDFCSQLPNEITDETISSISANLPACQFGFESAREALTSKELHSCLPISPPLDTPLIYSVLLPTGEAALEQWQTLWSQGYRTFKWKIGVASIQEELKIFDKLFQELPKPTQLRLDANGGLSWQEANEWLRVCDRVGIEFLEQPLPVSEVRAMLELSDHYSTQLALDESVATLRQLQSSYQQGWRGVFVIKAAIAGSPSRLRQFCHEHEIDAVFSTVFETTIGRQAALKLAAELSRHNRAVGFGINHWFDSEGDENWLKHLWQL